MNRHNLARLPGLMPCRLVWGFLDAVAVGLKSKLAPFDLLPGIPSRSAY